MILLSMHLLSPLIQGSGSWGCWPVTDDLLFLQITGNIVSICNMYFDFRTVWTNHQLLKNYLSDRCQCVRFEGSTFSSLCMTKGVPQGLILGPLQITFYTNSRGHHVLNANFYFLAHNVILYFPALTLKQAFCKLLTALILFSKHPRIWN